MTGANRGIGFETARMLAERDLHVVMACRDAEAGREAAERLRARGLHAEARVLDVADAQGCARAVQETLAAHGRVDVLVNNAGVALDEDLGVLDTPDEVLHETFEVNLLGAWRMCRLLVPGMLARGHGRVVNVSSGAGSLADIGAYAPAYSASKAALNALTRLVASECAGTDVKVNSACPGWVRTRMGGPSAPRTPVQGADTVVWLATLDASGPTNGFFRDRAPADW